MNLRSMLKGPSVIAGLLLVLLPSPMLTAQSDNSASAAANDNPTSAADHGTEELQSLVAPIALYPDSLVAQAEKFLSDEGRQNGLYWPVATGQAPSPLEGVRDFAKALGYTNAAAAAPQGFEGYYFRILTSQGDKAPGGARDYVVNGKMTGGFAVLAYPAEYRDSGIMTFIAGTDGVVYQKALAENTAATAQALTEYNPGDGWTPAS